MNCNESECLTIAELYVKFHNDGVKTNRFENLVGLFADDIEFCFEGSPFGPLKGQAAVLEAFAVKPPPLELIVHRITADAHGAEVVFAWHTAPDSPAGRFIFRLSEGKISHVAVTEF